MKEVELRIVQDQNGNVNVSGPLDNQVLCYGMLEIAKMVIRERALANAGDGPQERKITPVRFKPPNNLGND